MKHKKKISLTKGLLVIVLLCWLVPVMVFAGSLTVQYDDSIAGKIEILLKEELKNFSTLTCININEAIAQSKQVSYDRNLEAAWGNYVSGNLDSLGFYRIVQRELRAKYYIDKRFRMSAFYLSDEPEKVYYLAKSGEVRQEDYIKELHDAAKTITAEDDSYVHLLIVNDRICIIRNLYTTVNYRKFGTLVLELEPEELFDGANRSKFTRMILYTGNETVQQLNVDEMAEESSEEKELRKRLEGFYDTRKNEILETAQCGEMEGYLYQMKTREYHLGTMLLVDRKMAYLELDNLRELMVLLGLILVPLLASMIYFNYRHISRPVRRLTEAFRELEKGKLGVQITGKRMPNQEFDVLQDSFNNMSTEIHNLFDYAYQEKLASKDASIIAMQSQLNPHFLNNTLEMMNWQARMAGDTAVSKMIEALGTLLDFSMDRSRCKFVQMSEELRCADAYLYILSMRFGQRLAVKKDCDQELLTCEVPRLIIQPMLENAVKHGIEKKNQGTIELRIYQEESEIVLQIKNTGSVLDEEAQQKINKILTEPLREEDREKMNRVSLGIRNVNDRIKLIYGKEYGLTILPGEDGFTISIIRFPKERPTKEEDASELFRQWGSTFPPDK